MPSLKQNSNSIERHNIPPSPDFIIKDLSFSHVITELSRYGFCFAMHQPVRLSGSTTKIIFRTKNKRVEFSQSSLTSSDPNSCPIPGVDMT